MKEYIEGSDAIFLGKRVSKEFKPTDYKYHVKSEYRILEVLRGNLEVGQNIEFVHALRKEPFYLGKIWSRQELIVLLKPKNLDGSYQKDAPFYQQENISKDTCNTYSFTYSDLVGELRKNKNLLDVK